MLKKQLVTLVLVEPQDEINIEDPEIKEMIVWKLTLAMFLKTILWLLAGLWGPPMVLEKIYC